LLTLTKHICYTSFITEKTGVVNMAVGDRIKRTRNLRGLTQKELGVAVGFDEKTADVRIAQYESGTRTPKEDMLRSISEALDVNYRSLYEPSLYAVEDVLYTLFELDEHYGIKVIGDDKLSIDFNNRLVNDFLREWQLRKQELADGEITKEEYMEWKVNWPQTADDCGKFKPKKQWRR
ncbi:MAG: helix-turn-helix domain-containing protein, partial [Oscillospiraceae bacterium]|nr:helix-turn-helix domain-containing protein [Oscillospiraceae bacterium]